ncbi:MAG: c-type cytochrome [Rhodocyclaceae bacterium]|nr:c-type cytochrome [Rhodocyclaceae bacterium]
MNPAIPLIRRRPTEHAPLGGLLLAFSLALAPGLARAEAQQLAATVCAACHGPDGNSVAPTFPKLAGQFPAYLERQLADFKSGKRKSDIMTPIAASLGPEDMKGLATYFSAMKTSPGKVEDKDLAAAGEKLYTEGNPDSAVPACVSCHKEKGSGDKRYPRLAGQNQAYLIQQLMDLKSGVRTNDKMKLMQPVAGRLTEQEMKAAAEYLAGQ